MAAPKQSWQRVTELFEQALEQQPDQRTNLLITACAGQPDLLNEVQSLLNEHEAEAGFLESTIVLQVEPPFVKWPRQVNHKDARLRI